MELGKFIAKVISEIKENIKGPEQIGHIGGQSSEVELDLFVYPDGDKILVGSFTDNQTVNRIKIPLRISTK